MEGNAYVKDMVSQLIRDLSYRPEEPISDENVLYQTLKTEFAEYNTGDWFDVFCRESATIAELPYSGRSDEIRIQIARFTWFLVYVDDVGHRFPEYLTEFQKCIFAQNESPQSEFLVALRQHLTEYYRLYDPIPANCISLSAMDFFNGCILEQMPEISQMQLTVASHSWPYFLRSKTGSAHAYAFMLFPKETNLDMKNYLQVIDDIALFTNLANDVLSFYKEELAGEINNYVYNRARVSGLPIQQTLQEVVNETLATHARVTKALEFTGTVALAIWKQYVNGYM